jgi:hypothetical protein
MTPEPTNGANETRLTRSATSSSSLFFTSQIDATHNLSDTTSTPSINAQEHSPMKPSASPRPTSLAYRVSLRCLGLAVLLLACAIPAYAQTQVTGTSRLQFDSTDHNATIPAGEVGAGGPKVSSYQALLLLESSDAVSGPVVAMGAVVPKASVVASPVTVPPSPPYQLTYTQMGVIPPACTTIPCPSYTVVLVAIGTGGTSLRGVSSESGPFTATVPSPTSRPAAPTNVVNRP